MIMMIMMHRKASSCIAEREMEAEEVYLMALFSSFDVKRRIRHSRACEKRRMMVDRIVSSGTAGGRKAAHEVFTALAMTAGAR